MNITDTLRIRKYDDRNVVIEEYVTNTNPKTQKETSNWKFKGFYSNARSAIQAILDKDMLYQTLKKQKRSQRTRKLLKTNVSS